MQSLYLAPTAKGGLVPYATGQIPFPFAKSSNPYFILGNWLGTQQTTPNTRRIYALHDTRCRRTSFKKNSSFSVFGAEKKWIEPKLEIDLAFSQNLHICGMKLCAITSVPRFSRSSKLHMWLKPISVLEQLCRVLCTQLEQTA